uniref:BTB_2 domain-containing protein n=1 Tax=Trichuris muris TaxID=70415 RepID=A0A5S6QF43_TRIMR
MKRVICSLDMRDCKTDKVKMENYMISDFHDTGRALPLLMDPADTPEVIELHVGNCKYVTTWMTMERQEESAVDLFRQKIMASKFKNKTLKSQPAFANAPVILDFVERDGHLFRYILEYMRNGRLILPKHFNKHEALKKEALFYNLRQLANLIQEGMEKNWKSLSWLFSLPEKNFNQGFSENYITLSHLAGFTLARPGQSDAAFRKLNRISVCGKLSSCRKVFGNYLNESRDPNCEEGNQYTSRMFLKHNILEMAFDQLAQVGYHLLTCSASEPWHRSVQAHQDDSDWNHYMEYVFGKT